MQNSKSPRRWSKRRLLVVVSSLVGCVVLLVISVVGFARSLGFVMKAPAALGDVGEIAPEHAAPTGNVVPPAAPTSTVTETAPPNRSSGSSPGPSPLPTPQSPAGPVAATAGASGSGGAPATTGTTAAATGESAGTTSTGGVAGSAPTFWEDAVQSAVAVISQNTISMCGRNTCNTGQVCCNASCGVCVAPGATCDKRQCSGAPRTPTAVLCGTAQCNDGQVCCNASCGICTAPGATCSDQKCQ